MASETTAQTTFVQGNTEDDENIPPGVTAAAETSQLQVRADEVGYSSADPSGENKPVPDTCTFSSPAPVSSGGGAKTKSRISGLQSALTPILKYLNIGNKCPSPEPLKCGNSLHLSVPSFPFGVKKSSAGSSQHPNSNFSSGHSGRPLGDKDFPVYWLQDECLPEITLLDCTYDSTMQMTSNEGHASEIQTPKQSKQTGTTARAEPRAEVVHTPDRKAQSEHWLDDRYFPEITLLDVTRDSPAARVSPLEVSQDVSLADVMEHTRPLSELSGVIVSEPDLPVMRQSEELSNDLSGSVTNTTSSFSEQPKCVQENMKSSLEATLDISAGSVLETNTSTSSELSGQNTKSQTSDEDTLGIHSANVTRDISSSSDTSVQTAVSQFCASDVQTDTSLKNVTAEIHPKPVETSVAEDAFAAQAASSCTHLNSTDQMSSTQTLDLPPSNVNSPTSERVAAGPVRADVKNTTETFLDANRNSSAAKSDDSCDVQNATFDLHSLRKSCGSSTLGDASAASLCLQNTFDSKPSKQNGTITISETSSSDSHQNTLDKLSPSKVCNQTTNSKDHSTFKVSKQNGTTTPDLEVADTCENTSEAKDHSTFEVSKQNGTTTPDVDVADTCENTSEAKDHSTFEVSKQNGTTTPDVEVADTCENTSEAKDHSTFEVSKQNGTASPDPDVEMADACAKTSEAVDVAPAASGHDTKDHSQFGPDGLFYESLGHQGVDMDTNQANTFNLDDTLDLKVDSLVTSTPMTHCKAFHFTTEQDKIKPSKPAVQLPQDVPSKNVTEQKTLMQPTAKSLLPPLKAASQLLKYNPTSTLPGRCEQATSRLPMTRLRTQAEAGKIPAPSAQGTTGKSSSYNLRATTTASKQTNSGLPRPAVCGIPSGIQRSAPGLRLPSAKSAAATNLGTKITQPKKHPLSRGEPLPTAKRKKADGPLSSNGADAPYACDAVNGFKNLKRPGANCNQKVLPAKPQRDDAVVLASAAENTASCLVAGRSRTLKLPVNNHRAQPAKPQGHGCAKCVMLEEQLKIKSAEIKRLKEELLKYSKKGADC